MNVFKDCIKKDEYSTEELLTMFRVLSSELMKLKDGESRYDRDEIILKMQHHIKRQVSDAVERKSNLLRRKR